MKIIIHAGMHKTGSSAIQYNLSRFNEPSLRYASWYSSNHSAMFALLFGSVERSAKFRVFRRGGLSTAEIQNERIRWLAALEDDISAAKGKTFLFSAEVFSAPHSHNKVRDAARFFKEHGEVRIIAYVRPPISYMQSAIQQRLQGGNKIADFSGLYPKYRKRFEILDNLFGRDNVELIKYDRQTLRHGDVVCDFGSRIGLDISKNSIVQQNESLSLEAAGALYVQRNMGSGYLESHAHATAANKKLVNAVRQLGSTKIIFSAGLVGPILEEFTDDIAWIENRMGQSLVDSPSDKPTIENFDDLMAGAIRIIPELERLLGAATQNHRTLDYAVSLLEKLKTKCEQNVQPPSVCPKT